jgi:hypothetical protein
MKGLQMLFRRRQIFWFSSSRLNAPREFQICSFVRLSHITKLFIAWSALTFDSEKISVKLLICIT